MSHVCAHCGEMFPEGKPACPHCGADADLTWSEAPVEAEFAEGYDDDDPGPAGGGVRGRGCGGALLAVLALSGSACMLLL